MRSRGVGGVAELGGGEEAAGDGEEAVGSGGGGAVAEMLGSGS